MSVPDTMNRLNAEDDMFLKMYSFLPNVMTPQVAWVFDEPLPRATWARFDDHLAHGFGARRVRKTRIPFARPWFDEPLDRHPLDFDEIPVAEDDYLGWLWRKGEVDLDPYRGCVHRLSVSPTTAGGQIVSFVMSHAVLDGGGISYALSDAMRRLADDAPVSRAESSGRFIGSTPATRRRRAHLADARGQLRAVGSAVRSAWADRNMTEPPRNPRPESPRLDFAGDWDPSVTILETPMADWNRVAAERGGTANGLFIGLSVGMLGRCGRVADGASVRVDVPHSLRTDDNDPRGNAVGGLPIPVVYRAGARTDLTEIRATMKAALTNHDPNHKPAMAHMGPIQMMVPDRVAKLAVKFGKSPELLCSNLGTATRQIDTIGGVRARKVVFRNRLAPVPADLYRRLEAGLSIGLANDGETVTMAVAGLDPDRIPTREALEKLITDEFGAWGLVPTFWG
ncbi:hypothetical protein [Nocardia stercoris]|uniref:Diacylglycerol O-acyltransferase n=1 Tax=Nocardia stercoris TaxID=2483361 RepID=A0A3M2LCS9_9NOCA|nr:hypothetical protein [Nocardia stercoris]RMI35204.1 hypothetical protein EBN03_02605 [Nocardia stercoris]